MSGNPHGYGEVVYDKPAAKKEEDKTAFEKGSFVLWRSRNLIGEVIEDWRDYGIQIAVEDARGVESRHRVRRDELERNFSVLDILARI